MIIIHTQKLLIFQYKCYTFTQNSEIPLGKIRLFRTFEFGNSGKTAFFPTQTGARPNATLLRRLVSSKSKPPTSRLK